MGGNLNEDKSQMLHRTTTTIEHQKNINANNVNALAGTVEKTPDELGRGDKHIRLSPIQRGEGAGHGILVI